MRKKTALYKLISDNKEMKEYLENTDIVFIDTETTGLNPREEKIRLTQLKSPEKNFCAILDLKTCSINENNIYKLLKGKKLVFHNAKFDLYFLYKNIHKNFINEDIEDTMLIGKIFEPTKRYNLKSMVKKHLGIDIDKSLQNSDWSDSLTEEMLEYAALDVIYLEKLYLKLKDTYPFQKSFIYNLEKLFIKTLIKIEDKGIKIDLEKAFLLLQKLQLEYQEVENILNRNYDINPRSSKDIANALLKEGVQLPKTKKGNYCTSEDILKFINHELASNIIKYRKLKTKIDLLQSYIKSADENSRIHSTFNQLKTISGRMTSENPNIQNVPKEKDFREIFIAEENSILLGADYPQIELRIAAAYTSDKTMIDSLKKGIDLHKLIVSKATGKEYKEISEEERKLGKPVNFGLLYGMSGKTLKAYAKSIYGIDMSLEEAVSFKNIYKKTYLEINQWQDKTIRKLKKYGFVETETLGGRKTIAKRYTDALNYPIQGTGADMIKLACVYFDTLCKKYGIDASIVNIIHDEILVETNIKFKNATKNILKLSMEKAAKRFLKDIPCPVDVSEGSSWANMKN